MGSTGQAIAGVPPLDIVQKLAPLWISQAKDEDYEAGFKLIRLILAELKLGQLSDNTRFYLMDAMRQIAAGKDANAALHLKRPKSRPMETEQHIDIAIDVERYIQSGMSKAKAVETVAQRLNRDDTRNIEKDYAHYKLAAKAQIAMENLNINAK